MVPANGFFFPVAVFLGCVFSTNSDVMSGRSCTSNSDCFNELCLMDDSLQKRCSRKPKGYFNSMFQHLINDPDGVIPASMLEPTSSAACNTDSDCGLMEFCSASTDFSFPRIALKTRLNESTLVWHCYGSIDKQGSQIEIRQFPESEHWTDRVQFCNSDADCSNSNCVTEGFKRIVDLEMERWWKADEVEIYHPLLFGKWNTTIKSVDLRLLDGARKEWSMEMNSSNLYYTSRVLQNCSFRFQGPPFTGKPPTVFAAFRASFICADVPEGEFKEDVDISGGYFYFLKKYREFNGICGHPGLACHKCLIDGKFYGCDEDSECNNVGGDSSWIEKNEIPYCSSVAYHSEKFCKRKTRKCPIDSLNTDDKQTLRACNTDADCIQMETFTTFVPSITPNITYHPQCFNGYCCARLTACPSPEFPYAFPIESVDGSEQNGCLVDQDCNQFPELIGSCVRDTAVNKKIADLKKIYLNYTMRESLQTFGMCCYQRNEFCPTGKLQKWVNEEEHCRTDEDCNPDLPLYEWTSYCSGSYGDWRCCKEEPTDAMCPNSYIPYRSEVKCDNAQSHSDYSGECPKENSMCFKGHCCPRHNTNDTEIVTSDDNEYQTEIFCNPLKPVDLNYRFAYCNDTTLKITIMGSRDWVGEPLEWDRKRCEINSDCADSRMVCAHKISSLRFCVIPPAFSFYSPQQSSFPSLMTFTILLFLILVIVAFCVPEKPFLHRRRI